MKNQQKQDQLCDKKSTMQIPSCLMSTLSPAQSKMNKRVNEDLPNMSYKRLPKEPAGTPEEFELKEEQASPEQTIL